MVRWDIYSCGLIPQQKVAEKVILGDFQLTKKATSGIRLQLRHLKEVPKYQGDMGTPT